MKKVIALTGKKGTGKTTLALFFKAIIMRSCNMIEEDNFSGSIVGTDIFQYIENPYSIYYKNNKLDLDKYCDVEILSFAAELKNIAVSALGLDPSLVYGDQDCKNKITNFYWDSLPVWVRWINSPNKNISSQTKKIDVEIINKITSEEELWIACYDFNSIPTGLRCGEMTVREVLQVIGTDMFRKMFDDNIWSNCVRANIERSNSRFFILDDMRFESELDMVRDNFNHIIVNLDREMDSTDTHASEKGLSDVLYRSGCNFSHIASSDIDEKNDIAVGILRSFIDGK